MEDEQFIEAYTKLRSELRKVAPVGERMPYHWLSLPKPIPGIWMIYFGMVEDYACDLANVINQLANDIEKLSAWEKVLAEYREEERFYLVYEFVEPLCTMCLNVPYAIRSRIIFSVTHLSHQANMARLAKTWKDNLPKDDSINFKTMEKHAIHWGTYAELKANMVDLSDEKFLTEVNQYRNKYHHRYPCHIEFGLSETFKRNVGEKGVVSYSFGYSNPLQVKDIIPALKRQHAAAAKCFKSFQGLVQEQIEKMLTSSKP